MKRTSKRKYLGKELKHSLKKRRKTLVLSVQVEKCHLSDTQLYNHNEEETVKTCSIKYEQTIKHKLQRYEEGWSSV